MNTTMNLNAELLRELSYLADNENYLKKALKAIKKLVAQKEKEETFPTTASEEAEEYRPLSKAEVMENIRQAFEDAKLIREGKMKGIPAEDLLNEL
ncbi:MAG TPA: hypothetical protein H9814_02390 [Candidatus Bacteroides merdigallinarum]|uniref:Uncharacterized protein n=1 Tax=Candidatus Bacteroides merdigallinarum TaxID=2838473 RepID=A0A9D2E7T5_9BACE|nr:hypothetical protein [Candidatus Bacteroides merdigallinarum]